MSETKTFGIGLGEMFVEGVRGLRRQPVGLLVSGLITVAAYLAFRFPAQSATDDGNLVVGLGLDLIGLVAFDDFLILSENFGLGGGAGAASVPEQSGLGLLFVGFLALVYQRRGRN